MNDWLTETKAKFEVGDKVRVITNPWGDSNDYKPGVVELMSDYYILVNINDLWRKCFHWFDVYNGKIMKEEERNA